MDQFFPATDSDPRPGSHAEASPLAGALPVIEIGEGRFRLPGNASSYTWHEGADGSLTLWTESGMVTLTAWTELAFDDLDLSRDAAGSLDAHAPASDAPDLQVDREGTLAIGARELGLDPAASVPDAIVRAWAREGSIETGADGLTYRAGEDYAARKAEWTGRLADAASSVISDFRPHVVDTDTFTPRTIAKYTGKAGGNIYGAPEKILSGRTSLENLHLIGTDQGFLGIIGAMLSGISIANGVALR